ncbi:MAG TPA: DUF1254 domain-containing protein [Chloroflexota bacterium]|jgi:hypothetical protein|nr:DUF1254 domain-containing protein [Chloroflexota bacterium]
MDMWTDVFASPGGARPKIRADKFLVTPPSLGAKATGLVRIKAPTAYVWIIGRATGARESGQSLQEGIRCPGGDQSGVSVGTFSLKPAQTLVRGSPETPK